MHFIVMQILKGVLLKHFCSYNFIILFQFRSCFFIFSFEYIWLTNFYYSLFYLKCTFFYILFSALELESQRKTDNKHCES